MAGEKDAEAMASPMNNDQQGWRKSLGFGYGRNSFAGLDPERHGADGGTRGGIAPTHTVTTLGSIPNPPPPPRLTEKERVRNWVNRRLLPPEKRYPFGLNRRRFCLLVLLPLLLLLVLALALGLGLGFGLNKKKHDDASDLPLPSDLGGEDPPLTAYQGTFTYYSPTSDRIGACGIDVKYAENMEIAAVAVSYKLWDEAAKWAEEAAKEGSSSNVVEKRNWPYSLDEDGPRRESVNPLCGRLMMVGPQDGDVDKDEDWVRAMVVDRCAPERCPEAEDVDLTVTTFQAVYNVSLVGTSPDVDNEEEDGARDGWWAWPEEVYGSAGPTYLRGVMIGHGL